MSETDGILEMQPSGHWAVYRPGQIPLEIKSGDVFRVEVDGQLRPTRMEFRHFMDRREYWDQAGGYQSVDDYPLRDGLRAAFGTE